MLVEPVEVRLDRLDELLGRVVEARLVVEEDPVRRVTAPHQRRALEASKEERDEPLVMSDRVVDLLAADLRPGEVGLVRDNDSRRVEAGEDLRAPVCALADVLAVDPDVFAASVERLGRRWTKASSRRE